MHLHVVMQKTVQYDEMRGMKEILKNVYREGDAKRLVLVHDFGSHLASIL